jgi:chromosome partitioning protein
MIPGRHHLPAVITVGTSKGGVAKTTTAVNLSAALGERGRRVLLVDADHQANATRNVGVVPLPAGAPGLAGVLLEQVPIVEATVAPTNRPRVDAPPSTRELRQAEIVLPATYGFELRLRQAISELPRATYDYVIVDVPPNLGLLARLAIAASQYVLIPTQVKAWSLEGVQETEDAVERLRAGLMLGDAGPRMLGVIFTIVDRADGGLANEVGEALGQALLPYRFPRSRAAEWSETTSRPLTEAAGGKRFWTHFRALAAGVEARIMADRAAAEETQHVLTAR